MKSILSAVLFLAALPACAQDPVHSETDLAEGLRSLAWLLGNWEGQGRIGQTDFNEYSRWWPTADGRMLLEDAYAADTSGAVIHEDRIAIWKTRKDPVRCVLFEAAPPRLTEFELKISEEAVEFVPRAPGGATMSFRRKGASEFAYEYAAKGPDGKEIRASGSSRRSKNDFPARVPEKLAEHFQPLGAALRTWEGSCTSVGIEHGKAVLTGVAMFGGEVLEVLLRITTGDSAGAEIRGWVWREPDSGTWSGRLALSTTGVWPVTCTVRDRELSLQQEPDGRVVWSWKEEASSMRMLLDDIGREVEQLVFSGKPVPGEK